MHEEPPGCAPPRPAGGRPRGVAILGAGMIAEVHRRAALLAGATVTGVLASTPERSREVAARWRVERGYRALDEVLVDDRVDVVHVCTPNATHARYAAAALRAGKHVVCEKPLGVSSEEAEALTTLSEESGLVATLPFVYRYHPLVREIRARRLAGEFGRLHLLHGSYLQDWMLPPQASGWRVDPRLGGRSRAFADIGSHWCDLVEWVTGERFAEVLGALSIAVPERPVTGGPSFSAAGPSATAARSAPASVPGGATGAGSDSPTGTSSGSATGTGPDDAPGTVPVRTEDSATVLLRTADGVPASTVISQVAAGRKNRLWFELDGSEGSAVFDQENPETAWLGGLDGNRQLVRDPEHGTAEQRRLSQLPAGHAQGYAQCFESFVADTYSAIDGERPEGLPTFADGLRSARIVDAVLRSHHDDSWTKV
ncbi:Gfo/Idh/MocA family oxidoreductase [Streptomyces tubbatahanensis]|uniref:Gfo/Idh/MocA family oxidoreductase n=1 Tax=Streptomyces tubbatahanensis TaxID=2923272 RepID=A0ABY3XLN9_9ACTN|nr:Gfo/Idh/MocA family oxidoreductase [Streptomyces tubbatahanensis]UNS95332.1 Gfo/Idh/MocA family oxidoreductase [Streptomyces tubbatahanensis]